MYYVGLMLSSLYAPPTRSRYHLNYSVTDFAGLKSTAARVVVVVDLTPPVIELVGEAYVTIPFRTAFVDPGYCTTLALHP